MIRHICVRLHRWAGLTMTIFLVVVGLSGAALAFREEIDVWLNADLMAIAPREAPTLDPLELRERAEAARPDLRFDSAELRIDPGRTFAIPGRSRQASTQDAGPTQLFLDPYTGAVVGERAPDAAPFSRRGIVSFLYRLHWSLALPEATGALGPYVLGVVALVWTIDCFIGVYLTLPLPRRAPSAKSWSARWSPAWRIKRGADAYRINFDIHRAFGLWAWAMLFVYAWSGVMFNLQEVYRPVTAGLLGLSPQQEEAEAAQIDAPALGWRDAREKGRAHLEAAARSNGFSIDALQWLVFDRKRGVYQMFARSSLDTERRTRTFVDLDAETGALRRMSWPGRPGERAGDVVSRWLDMLHTAVVFGLPYKILACAMGFVITALSLTGAYIWWKKRSARDARHGRGRHAETRVLSR